MQSGLDHVLHKNADLTTWDHAGIMNINLVLHEVTNSHLWLVKKNVGSSSSGRPAWAKLTGEGEYYSLLLLY